jgi:hypothetical protein
MRWKARVTLGGSDVSASVVGRINIEAEESSARIADFSIIPATGSIDVTDWTGKAVVIDYLTIDASGSTLTDNTVFTGTVDLPVYDPQTGLVSFQCTDGYQQRFESMDESAILAELGGWYSESEFGEAEDGWQYAQDVLSTIPKSFDLNVDGSTGVLTAWEAKVTPDFSFDESVVIGGSVEIELARQREIHNKNVITFEYRFSRSIHREHDYNWQVPSWDFCTYYADTHELPNKEQITDAANGIGWGVQLPISFTELPDSGTYNCGGSVVWIINEDLQDQLVRQAAWTSVKRWSQTVTETYTMTVQAPQSITHFGEIAITDKGSLTTDYDDASWEDSEETSTPAGATQDAIDDWIIDRADRTESDNAIETKINLAAAAELEAHRRNYVTWQVMPISPTIERSHTAKLDTAPYEAQGKVAEVRHLMDIDSGEAITTIRIAISKSGTSTPPTPDVLTAPSAPSTAPTITPPATSTALGTQLGGKSGAPVHDPNDDGFSGNHTVTDFGAEIYPHQFKVDSAAIEDEVRNEATGSTSTTYNIVIPDETLVINV